jgi:hypothetical protein
MRFSLPQCLIEKFLYQRQKRAAPLIDALDAKAFGAFNSKTQLNQTPCEP